MVRAGRGRTVEVEVKQEEIDALYAQFTADRDMHMVSELMTDEPAYAEQWMLEAGSKHALARAIERERESLTAKFAEIRARDEKIMRHYAEAAIKVYLRTERQNCIDVLCRAIGDRRITDTIVQEMRDQPYPVTVKPSVDVLAERERCAAATQSALDRAVNDSKMVGNSRYAVAVLMLERLLKTIRGEE